MSGKIKMPSDNVTVYIKAERNVEVDQVDATLGDVLQMECTDHTVLAKLNQEKLYSFREKKESLHFSLIKERKKRVTISILDVISIIGQRYPNVSIENIGESDFIITYEEKRDTGGVLHVCKVVTVFLISFIGAAFSTMAFNNDVDVRKMFAQIYELLTGTESNGFTVLELSYCIGVVIGILIFFNHFGKRRFCKEPTPIEVEMRLYENDVQTTLIENESRKEAE